MIHFELCYKKYHRSIIKNVIKGKRLRVYTLPFIVKVLTFAP